VAAVDRATLNLRPSRCALPPPTRRSPMKHPDDKDLRSQRARFLAGWCVIRAVWSSASSSFSSSSHSPSSFTFASRMRDSRIGQAVISNLSLLRESSANRDCSAPRSLKLAEAKSIRGEGNCDACSLRFLHLLIARHPICRPSFAGELERIAREFRAPRESHFLTRDTYDTSRGLFTTAYLILENIRESCIPAT